MLQRLIGHATPHDANNGLSTHGASAATPAGDVSDATHDAQIAELVAAVARTPQDELSDADARQALIAAVRAGHVIGVYKAHASTRHTIELAGIPRDIEPRVTCAQWVAWWRAGKDPAAENIAEHRARQRAALEAAQEAQATQIAETLAALANIPRDELPDGDARDHLAACIREGLIVGVSRVMGDDATAPTAHFVTWATRTRWVDSRQSLTDFLTGFIGYTDWACAHNIRPVTPQEAAHDSHDAAQGNHDDAE